jgi:SAM-dependent methyltransferase
VAYTSLAYRLPRPLRKLALHFEVSIEDAVAHFAEGLTARTRVLDAGAGEGQYAKYFSATRYTGVDLAVGDAAWNYGQLDALCDLNALPFADGAFDAALNIVTLEHLRDPQIALREMARTMKPGAPLLLVAPHEWEVHQSPHDYFRYTRHGLDLLLGRAGFAEIKIAPAGGYFRLLARRLLNGLQFFTGGARWLLFVPAAALLVPAAIVLPLLEPLDRQKNFTLGYICTARKSS